MKNIPFLLLAGVTFLWVIPTFADEPTKPAPLKPKDPPPPPVRTPAPPVPFPSPPPISRPTPPTPSPSIPQPKPFPPVTPIKVPVPRFTTVISAPINPRVMKPKGGNPAQVFLGNLTDARDLDVTIDNTDAQWTSAKAAFEAYEKIFEGQKKVYLAGSLSPDDYAQSQFDMEWNGAIAKVYEAFLTMYRARQEQKIYQAMIAAKKETFDLEKFHRLYTKEWDGQCAAANALVQTSEAQHHLNHHLLGSTQAAYGKGAASYPELEQRLKDVAAADADVKAKQGTASKCRVGLPSLQDLESDDGGDGVDDSSWALD